MPKSKLVLVVRKKMRNAVRRSVRYVNKCKRKVLRVVRNAKRKVQKLQHSVLLCIQKAWRCSLIGRYISYGEAKSIRELILYTEVSGKAIGCSLVLSALAIGLRVVELHLMLLFIRTLLQFANGSVVAAIAVPVVNVELPRLLCIVLLFVSVTVVSSLCSYQSDVLMRRQLEEAEAGLRKHAFRRLLLFGKQFYDQRSFADIQRYLLQFPQSIAAQMQTLHTSVSQTLMLFAFIGVLFWLSWRISAVVFVVFILVTIIYSCFSARFRTLANKEHKTRKRLDGKIFNILTGMPLVKTVLGETKERQYFDEISDNEVQAKSVIVRQQASIQQLHNILSILAILLVALAIVYFGEYREPGRAIMYLIIVRMMSPFMPALGKMRNSVSQGTYVTRELLDLLKNDENKYILTSGSYEFEGVQKAITLRDVSFSYDKKRGILEGVSCTIPAGSTVAIVGATGSGKSTIAQLLVRFYDVDSGNIAIDGKDIRECNTASLRRQIAYLTQDTFLFNETLQFNIEYGNEDIGREAIEDALFQARLHDTVERLPKKLDTMIGDRGVQLSGGERQRAAITRALLQEADIWILDEAFSALDAKTEVLIQQTIQDITRDKTLILISHRLSLLPAVDSIICLEDGRIAEQGSFEELLHKKDGVFADMWQQQHAHVSQSSAAPSKKSSNAIPSAQCHSMPKDKHSKADTSTELRFDIFKQALQRQRYEMQQIKQSLTYKIGSFFTYVPSKIIRSLASLYNDARTVLIHKKRLFTSQIWNNAVTIAPGTYPEKLRFRHSFRSGLHRCGWTYAVDALRPLHADKGILCDDFIETNFAWNDGLNWRRTVQAYLQGKFDTEIRMNADVLPYREPWIGFLHNPHNIPEWMQTGQSPQEIFCKDIWLQSMQHCRGIFCLSQYHKEWLDQVLDVPVCSLIHPTEIPETLFNPKAFLKNDQRKIIQIGWWLRRMHSIFELPTKTYQKMFLHIDTHYSRKTFKREAERLNYHGDYSSAKIQTFVPNDEYDDLMSQNIVFLHLYDSSANNAVIECIARGTPILVNPLPAVQEYLGKEYPLYFSTLTEAAQKAEDTDLVLRAHKYLMELDTRKKLSADYFCVSMAESDIYSQL